MYPRKNILINIVLFSFLFLLCSCGYRGPAYGKIIRGIAIDYIDEVAVPKGLMLSSYGGAMMDDIKVVILSFNSFDKLNVDQARGLYVELMEEFLCRINCHEKVRPYLHNYPFEVKNVDLMLGFDDPATGWILADGHVAQVGIGKNDIMYFSAYDKEKKFYDLHEEPYEEALKIVRGSSTCIQEIERRENEFQEK